MEQNQKVILSVKDLNVKFNLRGKVLHAIRGINLDVYQGESLAIVGESGCGKSVLNKNFIGLLDPNGFISSGEITYYGMDDGQPQVLSNYKKDNEWLKIRGSEVSMIMQDPMTSLNPLKTIGKQIGESLELHQGLKGKALKEAVYGILRDVGIEEPERRYKQYPHEFSGGMRQRAALLRTLLTEKETLLLDEPFGALDALTRLQLQMDLTDMWQEFHKTILLVTHDVEEALFLSSSVLVVERTPIRELAEIPVPASFPRDRSCLKLPEMVELKEHLIDLLRKQVTA